MIFPEISHAIFVRITHPKILVWSPRRDRPRRRSSRSDPGKIEVMQSSHLAENSADYLMSRGAN